MRFDNLCGGFQSDHVSSDWNRRILPPPFQNFINFSIDKNNSISIFSNSTSIRVDFFKFSIFILFILYLTFYTCFSYWCSVQDFISIRLSIFWVKIEIYSNLDTLRYFQYFNIIFRRFFVWILWSVSRSHFCISRNKQLCVCLHVVIL